MAGIELTLLGRFAARRPSGPIPLAGRKLAGLLAVLAVAPPALRTRDALQSLLWGSHSEDQARQSLRQALARLRRIIGAEAIVTDDQTIGLSPDFVECDASRLTDLAARHDRDSLAAAVQLYQGPFLADVSIREERWNEWLEERRRQLETIAVDTMVRLATLQREGGRSDLCLAQAEAAIAVDAFREDAHRLMIAALGDLGRRADAVRHFAELTEMLRQELGTAPDPATTRLIEELRQPAETPSATTAGAPTNIGFPASTIVRAGADLGQCPARLAIRGGQSARGGLARASSRVRGEELGPEVLSVRQVGEALIVDAATVRAASRMALALQSDKSNTATSATTGNELAIGIDLVPDRVCQPATDRESAAVALAAFAPDGAILASEDVRDHLVDGLDATLNDLGMIRPPGQTDHLRAFALQEPHKGAPPNWSTVRLAPTLAVVPIVLAASSGLDGVVGDLLAEEAIAFVSQSKYIDVISFLSTRALAQRQLTVPEIARHIGGDYVVSGQVSASGGRHRITVELIDGRSGVVRWRGEHDCKLSHPEAVREIAQWLALEVTAAIYTAESHRAAAGPLASLDAYTLFFAATSLMDRWTFTGFQRAGELLHALLERAPAHPLPNAWLAAWHIRSISQGWTTDARADGTKASDFARRALDIDPYNSVALTMDGWAEVYGHNRLDLASDKLAFAVDVNPSDCLAWLLKGVAHAFKGEGALASPAVQRALRLAPLDPRRSYYESMSATAEVVAGNYERALELGRSSFRANRMHASTLRVIALAQWWSGREDEARASVRQLMAMAPGFTVSGYLKSHPVGAGGFGKTVGDALLAAGVPA